MKQKLVFFMVFLFSAILPINSFAAKASISIPELNNKAGIDKNVADSFVDMLSTAFTKTRKFSVLERSSLDKIANEQMFSASGAVDPKTAVKMGKMTGASFVLVGSITSFGTEKKETGAFGIKVSSSESKIGIDIRLVDSTTGTVVMAESFSKAESKSGIKGTVMGATYKENLKKGPLADLARIVANQISKKCMFAVFPPKIIQVKADTVAVNYGDGVLSVGELYDIYSLGEALIDPDTGEILGAGEELVGSLKINRTTAKFCYADIIEGGAGIQKGMILRPQVEVAEKKSSIKVPW